MDRLCMVLSGECDYERLLVPDCGPFYSRALGMESVAINEATWSPATAWIIDTRLTKEEVSVVTAAIRANPSTRFLIYVVDPYWETAEKTNQLHFAFRCAAFPNVGYLSPYQSEEVVGFLADAGSARKAFFVSPYAYNRENEVDFDETWTRRKRGIALAGIPNQSIYPYRSFLHRKRPRDVRLWGKVGVLQHPGYPDLGMSLSHDKVGESFVQWLAGYESCYLCPSRCRLEFIKYRECAYAGCCPVGAAPGTMTGELSDLIVPLDWQDYRAKRDRWLAMSPNDLKNRALAYREAMRRERDPQLLRSQLMERLADWRI
jgi:hypothetical protein